MTTKLDYYNLTINTIISKEKWKKDEERNVGILINEQIIEIKEKFLKNAISENRKIEAIKTVNEDSCWLDVTKDKSLMRNDRKKHKKVFFFIVDALRLDFMVRKDDSFVVDNNTITAEKDESERKKDGDNSILNWESRNNDNNDIPNEKEKESTISDPKEDKTINELKSCGFSAAPTSSFSPPLPPSSPTSPYNKFKNMHQLLQNNATQTAFFGFRADPPTVTSQRLKGVI